MLTKPATEVPRNRSDLKHAAILTAATDLFLRQGYANTNMDEVTAAAGVSKQTVYSHFGSKDALFIEMVTSLCNAAGDRVLTDPPLPTRAEDMSDWLLDYGFRQLRIVLTPQLMQLRRLVIGEAERFPELGRVLYDAGPGRAIKELGVRFQELSARGLLRPADPAVMASRFNWLVMADPVNATMLLGNAGIPDEAALHAHAEEAVRIFLLAYGA